MPNKVDKILHQDKYHLVIYKNTLKHPIVIMRPKVKVIIHDVTKDELLLLQDEWVQDNYGFFLTENILYEDVLENLDKTQEETLKDAFSMAETICKMNGVIPKNLKLFSSEFNGRIHCSYYYFIVTDFQKKEVETVDIQNWISVEEILNLIKENVFLNPDDISILFKFFLQENKIVYNKT